MTASLFAPDGLTFVSGGTDTKVCLWDATSGTLRQRSDEQGYVGRHRGCILPGRPEGRGGESGRVAHPFQLEWACDLIGQYRKAGVACFLKQLGSTVFSDGRKLNFADNHSGDWSEWPKKVRVRQMPRCVPTSFHEKNIPLLGVDYNITANNTRIQLEVIDKIKKGRQACAQGVGDPKRK